MHSIQSIRSSQIMSDEGSTKGDLLTDPRDNDEHQLPLVNERQLPVHSPTFSNCSSEPPLSTKHSPTHNTDSSIRDTSHIVKEPEASQKLNQSIIEHNTVTDTLSMNETLPGNEAVKSGIANDNDIDDVSLTPTISEIEEELTGVTDEDTLFEETAMKSSGR